jgi:glycosyltransferase involved in cell wall biosynthesis
MEAMSAGLPVVASEVGGVPGIISSGTDGILVPPGNPQALAEVLLDLCEDASKREKLGKAAASKAASEFRMSKMISSYEELYRGDEN